MVRLLKTHLFSLFQIMGITLRFYKLTSDHTLLAKQSQPPLLQSSSPECCNLGMEAVEHQAAASRQLGTSCSTRPPPPPPPPPRWLHLMRRWSPQWWREIQTSPLPYPVCPAMSSPHRATQVMATQMRSRGWSNK